MIGKQGWGKETFRCLATPTVWEDKFVAIGNSLMMQRSPIALLKMKLSF